MWTDPKTFAVGEVLTAADMNTYVRDNTNALRDGSGRIGACIRLASGQTVPNSGALVAFDTALYANGCTNDVASGRSITVGSAGTYRITGSVHWADAGSSFALGTLIQLNGVTVGTGGYELQDNTGFSGQVVAYEIVLPLAASDVITLYANQNTGGNKTILSDGGAAGYGTFLLVERMN